MDEARIEEIRKQGCAAAVQMSMPEFLTENSINPHGRAALASIQDTLWPSVVTTINNLKEAGATPDLVKAIVDTIINATPLPAFLKGFILAMANSMIDAIFAGIPMPIPVPPPAPVPHVP